jgi:hypothetical protein
MRVGDKLIAIGNNDTAAFSLQQAGTALKSATLPIDIAFERVGEKIETAQPSAEELAALAKESEEVQEAAATTAVGNFLSHKGQHERWPKAYDVLAKIIHAQASSKLAGPDRVPLRLLEVGCTHGMLVEAAAAGFTGGTFGIDFSEFFLCWNLCQHRLMQQQLQPCHRRRWFYLWNWHKELQRSIPMLLWRC